jgi:DHA2 family multidrug resistance protein
MLATFMEILDTSVANVALPHIAGNLSATSDEATWVLTSYLVSNAIILPAAAWLGSFFGRKKFLTWCIVIFTVSSAACGAALSLNMLVLARILQGAGGGALQPIAQAVLMESFPPHKRGQAMALYGMGVVVAPILGPTLGGWITDNYSWRWIFYINLPIGAAAIAMVSMFVEDPPWISGARPGTIDGLGFGLMALWLGTLQVILDKGQENDWFATAWICWFAFLSTVAFILFIWRELAATNPIVDLRVLKNRNFLISCLTIGVIGVVLFGSTALLPLFLQNLMGYPALLSGMAVSPRGVGAFASMIIVGRLVGRVDARRLIAGGFIGLTIASWMLADINLQITVMSVMIPQVLQGFCMGFIFVPLTTLSTGTLPREQMGNASGIYNLFRNLGGSFGISFMTTFLERKQQYHQLLLSQHMTPYDFPFTQAMARMQHALSSTAGAAGAKGAAFAAMYGQLLTQATSLAFIDCFRLMAVLAGLCIPLAFLLKKVAVSKGPVAVH